MIHDNYDDYGYAHENDNNTGWHYRDEPYGGFLVAEETEVECDGVSVTLGVCVEFTNLEDACGEPGFLVDVKHVVSPDSLSERGIEKVASSGCRYDDDGKPIIDYYDVAMYGFSKSVDNVWGAETWEEGYDEVVGSLAFGSVAPGFSLDAAYNMLGTTGWDIIRDATQDIDAHDASMDRLRDQVDV